MENVKNFQKIQPKYFIKRNITDIQDRRPFWREFRSNLNLKHLEKSLRGNTASNKVASENCFFFHQNSIRNEK